MWKLHLGGSGSLLPSSLEAWSVDLLKMLRASPLSRHRLASEHKKLVAN